MKKLAVAVVLALLVSILAGTLLVNMGAANPIGFWTPHTPPPAPAISVSSPENNTIYSESWIALSCKVSSFTWYGYGPPGTGPKSAIYQPTYSPIQCWLDGVVVAQFAWNTSVKSNPNELRFFYQPFNFTIARLSDGVHSIEITAAATGSYLATSTDSSGQSVSGTITSVSNGSSGKIYFTVDTTPPSIPKSEPFPTTWVIVATIAAIIAGIVLAKYYTKNKKGAKRTNQA